MRRSPLFFALLALASTCRPRVARDAGTASGTSIRLPYVTDTALDTPPLDAIEVNATPDRVEIGGVSVALADHRFPIEVLQGGVNGLLVQPLAHLARPTSHTAVIRADRALTSGVIVRVLYTLAQQDVATFAFVATIPGGPTGVITVHLPTARSRVARAEQPESTALRALAALMNDASTDTDASHAPAPFAPPMLRMLGDDYVVRVGALILQPDCATVGSSGITVHANAASDADRREIRRCLVAARTTPATRDAMAGNVILLTVTPNETYDSIVQRLATVRESRASAVDLYTDPLLAVVR